MRVVAPSLFVDAQYVAGDEVVQEDVEKAAKGKKSARKGKGPAEPQADAATITFSAPPADAFWPDAEAQPAADEEEPQERQPFSVCVLLSSLLTIAIASCFLTSTPHSHDVGRGRGCAQRAAVCQNGSSAVL